MNTIEDFNKAKQYLSEQGYGTGNNFTLNTVANLMAEWAAKNCSIPAVMRSVVWKPTNQLRWKRVEIDKLLYEKVLQQLWHGDMGEQEWRDVPEED